MPAAMRHLLRAVPVAVLVASVLVALLLPGEAEAHKYYGVLSRVDHNPRAGTLEVIHRFFVHDLEVMLSRTNGREVHFDDANPPEAELRAYLADHFGLRSDNADLALQWVGMELEGEILETFQEAAVTGPPGELLVRNRLLVDAFDSETNTVTVTIGDQRLSATFREGEGEAQLTFR